MKKIFFLFLAVVLLLGVSQRKVLAATGIITGTSAYAWGENIGWINFLATGSGITVTDTAITGYAWSPNYGWINLAPTTSGVKNTCAGVLSGHAWSETMGWIDFNGVQINSNGKFTGMAGTTGSTAGRVNFDCDNCGVVTTWRPSCATSTTTSSSSTSSVSSGGGGSTACTATKPSGAPTILSAVSGENSVTLNWSNAGNPFTYYLIAYGNRPGEIKYGNPNVGNVNSYTIRGLSGGSTYYFKVKAVNDCMPGDYSNEMSGSPSGRFIAESAVAEGFINVNETGNPSQLFDIALIVDETKIAKGSDLKARVTFVSFGSELTPVNMSFSVMDANGKEYYNSKDYIEIQTEGVFNKAFDGLNLADGKYTLVLTTLYNKTVKDEFKQDFEVSSAVQASFWKQILNNKWLVFGTGGALLLLLFGIIFALSKKKVKKWVNKKAIILIKK